MKPIFLLSSLAAWWQRLACRMREAERVRRDRQVLSSMSAQELRDIGISHPALATAANRVACCE